ncbi:MAG: TetR/AcrR family transcriptional regulator [Pseudomonadales bacterium]|nr:TetR/AcrR family transcriptional regulator [Pseudomonadales bacterium]NRA18102.1 TetR/AcrR family transcriptional regulator [Oceanospirillaceae bacterium]
MSKSTQKPHHHGDLRAALILSGIELLEEGGVTALTLRKCAARAGVSHAAPAHHFEGLQGLIRAITDRGMSMFATAMQSKIDAAEDSPFPRLYAMCEGYLNFFIEHQALANLMFNQKSELMTKSAGGRTTNAAFNILVSACAPFIHGPLGHQATEYAVWSLIQGFSHLTVMGQISCDPNQPQISVADLFSMLNLQVAE